MRKQSLPDEEIKYILKLIDKKEYTQQEIAERYHVSQGTISRYNRVKRAQFKLEKYSHMIAKMNKEIIQLKSALHLDLTEELSIPKSFKHCKVVLENGDKLHGYVTHDHYEACRYVERHPEYHIYALAVDKKDSDIPTYFRGRARADLFSYFISPKNYGHITRKNQIKITEYVLGKGEE